MADQASIFGNTDGTTNPNADTPGGNTGTAPTDNLTTLLGSIKNERGEPKYKTVEDALKALQHSQEFIPSLKTKNEELERKVGELSQSVTKLSELERVVQELTQTRTAPTEPTPQAGFSEEQVAELVARTLSRTQQEAIQKTNLQTVADKVKSKFGDKAEEAFYGRAAELGMTREEFNALAARTPKAVLKLVGIEEVAVTQTVNSYRPPAGINTEGLTPAQDSALRRNDKRIMLGATTEDLRQETAQAKKLVEELEAAGMSISDLTNPKNYNKYFGKV